MFFNAKEFNLRNYTYDVNLGKIECLKSNLMYKFNGNEKGESLASPLLLNINFKLYFVCKVQTNSAALAYRSTIATIN